MSATDGAAGEGWGGGLTERPVDGDALAADGLSYLPWRHGWDGFLGGRV